jgi:hypothetical protein
MRVPHKQARSHAFLESLSELERGRLDRDHAVNLWCQCHSACNPPDDGADHSPDSTQKECSTNAKPDNVSMTTCPTPLFRRLRRRSLNT